MSTLSQFAGGNRPPKLLVQRNAVAGWTQTNISDSIAGAKNIFSGALTANTLATVLSISGAGELQYLSISPLDATTRTLRLALTIDGVLVYDYTSAAATSGPSYGGVIVGGFQSGAVPGIESLKFNSSVLVKIASSLTETNLIQIGTRYRMY